jgi:hypothetical protein
LYLLYFDSDFTAQLAAHFRLVSFGAMFIQGANVTNQLPCHFLHSGISCMFSNAAYVNGLSLSNATQLDRLFVPPVPLSAMAQIAQCTEVGTQSLHTFQIG